MTPAARLTLSIMTTVADACAWVIGLGRDITQHRLTDDECEAQGLPFDSTDPNVFCRQSDGLPWWHLDCWTDAGDGKPGDSCFNLQALGCHVEVYSKTRRQEAAAA